MSQVLANLQQSWRDATAPWRQRWLLLAPRDQRVLLLLAVVILAVVLFYGVWQPSHRAALKMQQQFEQNRLLVSELARQGPRAAGPVTSGASLLSVVSESAAAAGLSFSRTEPEGDAQLRLWVERTDFNQLAAWLAALSAQGVRVQEVQVDKQADGQGVSGRLVLVR